MERKSRCDNCKHFQWYISYCNYRDNHVQEVVSCEYFEPEVKGETMSNDGKKNSVEIHAEICNEINELYIRKNHDYGDSFHKQFVEWDKDVKNGGLVMSAMRIGDKYSRIRSLLKEDAKVKDESIEDTLTDLANYAIMTLIELRRKEKPEK